MNFIIFIIIPAAMLIIIEIFQRKFSISPIVTRKMSHISAALIAAISPLFLNKDLIILICLGFAGLMFWSRRNNFLSSIHTRIRNTFGEVFLPLGEAFSAAIFLPQATPAFQYEYWLWESLMHPPVWLGKNSAGIKLIFFAAKKVLKAQ